MTILVIEGFPQTAESRPGGDGDPFGAYASHHQLPIGSYEGASAEDIADFEAHIRRQVGGRSEPDRTKLERFLRANPGCTVRDWKGKGPSIPLDAEPWAEPWHRLKPAKVREAAAHYSARELPHNVRQAAARDTALVWNPLGRKYRLRAAAPPAPSLANGEAFEGGRGI